jgi:hypothetical protein
MSGFRAVQPETRADRAAKQDKTTLEKSRLAQRKEKFIRYVDAGPPTEMQAGAVGFLPDADRFHSDTAGEEKRHRDGLIQKREELYENKRNQVKRLLQTDAMMVPSVRQGKGNASLFLGPDARAIHWLAPHSSMQMLMLMLRSSPIRSFLTARSRAGR